MAMGVIVMATTTGIIGVCGVSVMHDPMAMMTGVIVMATITGIIGVLGVSVMHDPMAMTTAKGYSPGMGRVVSLSLSLSYLFLPFLTVLLDKSSLPPTASQSPPLPRIYRVSGRTGGFLRRSASCVVQHSMTSDTLVPSSISFGMIG